MDRASFVVELAGGLERVLVVVELETVIVEALNTYFIDKTNYINCKVLATLNKWTCAQHYLI